MIQLANYLYDGDTVVKILQKYTADLRKSALEESNEMDLIHADFLSTISDMLEHNDFLTMQSRRIHEFYKYMVSEYPYLAFCFKGRIKSLIRAEEKFNRYIVEYVYDYYRKTGKYPDVEALRENLPCFRDLIAYRIIISIPKCHLKNGEDRDEEEKKLLYEIANRLPGFLKDRDFSVEPSGSAGRKVSKAISEEIRPYVRDYVEVPSEFGYQSLHMTFFDNMARCHIEVQLRSKRMDDNAEIGAAEHIGYEKRQELADERRSEIPKGRCKIFDDAYERVISLQNLDLSKIDVNMFAAVNNSLVNDGCGLYKGRLITPYEHLSRFQNDYMD